MYNKHNLLKGKYDKLINFFGKRNDAMDVNQFTYNPFCLRCDHNTLCQYPFGLCYLIIMYGHKYMRV